MQSLFSYLRLICLGAVLAIAPVTLHGQQDSDSEWNHFGLNFRAAFNVNAKFSEPALNGGFVKPDSSTSGDSLTWNWGYKYPSKIGPLAGAPNGPSYLQLNDIQGASERTTDNPEPGFDLNYVRDLGHESWGQWGIKFAIGYTPLNVRDGDTMSANGTTANYALNGITAPQEPYTGSYYGPGPVISSSPTGTPASSVVPISGERKLDAALVDLRLGPSFNIRLYRRLSLQTGGGFALGIVPSRFTFSDSIPGAAPVSGSDSHTGVNPGAYAELGFAYRLCRSASVFTGAQFEYLGNFQQSVDGRSAELDLGSTIFYEFGLQWHF